MSKLTCKMLCGLFVLVTVLGLSKGAKAAGALCTIQSMIWNNTGFYITCVGRTARLDTFSGATCTDTTNVSRTVTHSLDEMKLFYSTATAAFLAGKPLNAEFVDCNTGDDLLTGVGF
jgi:hypothetical protein